MARNRETVMLAKKYDRTKHKVGGWMVSVKYDGVRAWWDGGVSRGRRVRDIPWANMGEHLSRLRDGEGTATGLWSRYNNVIHAPGWWLDRLPEGVTLDGELWMGRGGFQRVCSVVLTESGEDKGWAGVVMVAFESPPVEVLFRSGRVSGGNIKKWIDADACLAMAGGVVGWKGGLIELEEWLAAKAKGGGGGGVMVCSQQRLPMADDEAAEEVERLLLTETALGGEGLMLRSAWSVYDVKRVDYLLKVKKLDVGTGTVVDWTPGTGELEGMMGGLVLEGGIGIGTGFKREERIVAGGWPVLYPKGMKVRYVHRGLTDSGLPRECRLVPN